jgi:predicted secreted hydrolase
MNAKTRLPENMAKMHSVYGILLFVAFISTAPAVAVDDEAYYALSGSCSLEFPRNHGAHPGFRTEWWYYTGNVETAQARRFGYQLTIFRRQISPPGAARQWPDPASKWRTQQLYLGHIALSDIDGKGYYTAEEISRGVLGLAGVRQSDGQVSVYIKNLVIEIGPQSQRLRATSEKFSFDLFLKPLKEPVLHGDRGYSRKGDTPERASCYYSFSRLQTRGKIKLDDQEHSVSGLSWMDHEFSTADLQPGIDGWDWFSLQLDNGSDLMLYVLRQADGHFNPASSGTFVDENGATQHLALDEFKIETLDTWQSPHSGGRYPSRWRLTVDMVDLQVLIEPNLADQEMRTPDSTGVTYWEGSVSVQGQARGRPVKGKGYVELTGYADGSKPTI